MFINYKPFSYYLNIYHHLIPIRCYQQILNAKKGNKIAIINKIRVLILFDF